MKNTSHTVEIEGNQVVVMQYEGGRLFARLPEPDGNGYREWHAMDMATLQERIKKTTNRSAA